MSPSKKIYYSLCSLLPTPLLIQAAPSTTLLPYHHLVSDNEVLHIKHLYPYKNVQQFTADLDCLLKHLQPVSAETIKDAFLSGKKLPAKSFLLSFDDGFREVYDVIAPILQRKGVPAIFFINPAFVDNKELFYRCKISLVIEQLLQKKNDRALVQKCAAIVAGTSPGSYENVIAAVKKITNLNKQLLDELAAVLNISFTDYLEKEQPFLTTQQLTALSKMGFTIGAHSWDHPYYHLIADADKIDQTIRSANYVAEKFNQPTVTFSFPHSDAELKQSFFTELISQSNIDLLFGIQNQKEEQLNNMLHRFNAERPALPMSKQLNGVLLLMVLQKLLNKNKVTRK